MANFPERPEPRWNHSSTHLDNYAVATWTTDPQALAARLPEGFTPDTHVIDGHERALISMVAFQDRDLHFRFCPPAKVSHSQIDYLAYVRHEDTPGIWFLWAALDSPLVVIPRLLWQMPWRRQNIRFDTSWDNEELLNYRMTATESRQTNGSSHRAELVLEPLDFQADSPTDSANADELTHIIADPLVGWYPRLDRGVGRYTVWHPPLDLIKTQAVKASSSVFEELKLITPDQQPIDTRVARECQFDIHTPPTRIR